MFGRTRRTEPMDPPARTVTSTLEPRAQSSALGTVGGVTTTPVGLLGRTGQLAPLARVGSLRAKSVAAPASPAAATPAQPAKSSDADRLDKIESVVFSMAKAMGISMGDEEDAKSETDEEDAENTDDTDEDDAAEAAAPKSKSGHSTPMAATPEQIEAACKGADPAFVLTCIKAKATVEQARIMFAGSQSRVPGRRNRAPLQSGRASSSASGGDESPVARVQSLIESGTAEHIKAGKSAADARGLAMRDVKRLEPLAFVQYTEAVEQKRQRDLIGAAAVED